MGKHHAGQAAETWKATGDPGRRGSPARTSAPGRWLARRPGGHAGRRREDDSYRRPEPLGGAPRRRRDRRCRAPRTGSLSLRIPAPRQGASVFPVDEVGGRILLRLRDGTLEWYVAS